MFYDNLKLECDKQNLKITKIVAECGGAKGSISNWKKGASPNSDIVAKLAVRLNVSTDYLLFGTDNISLTENSGIEKDLIENFKKLSEYEKGYIMGEIKQMLQNKKHLLNSKPINID